MHVPDDLFETAEEMYRVIEAGAVSYDAVCPSDYMIQKMVENGLLAEINFENVPNIANIDPVYLEKSKAFDPENLYSVPYTWGTVGIIYNVQKLEDLGVPAPTKWSDLWDERLKGEILMQDSVRDAFMVALKELGYSMNTTDVGELEEAKKLLLAQKPLVQAYVVDQVRDKMLNGEAAVGVKEENGMTSGPMFWVLYIVLLGGMLYFMAIRPQKKEKQKQQELLNSVAVGDTILTSSGFYGVIIDMTDDMVIVEFGSNKNCRIPMRKDAIVQVEKPEV